MTTLETLTVIYLVMAIITALVAYDHLANPRFYRAVCSIVTGVFWPIPVALFIMLWVERALKYIINYFNR